MNTSRLPKAHAIMLLVLPLAVILGYFLVDPLEPSSLTVVGLVLAALAVPLMMQWYHPMLIVLWNASIAPLFVPGTPYLWMLVAVIGLGIAVLNRSVNSNFRFLSVPSITFSLMLLVLVVLVTAYLNGGIGSQILGISQFGGRRYFYTFLSVIGYFALISQRIPRHRAVLYTSLFFLSYFTALVPDFLGMMGSTSSLLYLLFPPDVTAVQAVTGQMQDTDMFRILGLTTSSIGLFCFLLAKYGLRGVLTIRKPLRLSLCILAFIAAGYSGFRSILLLLLIIFAVQFWIEGLHRTQALPVVLGVGLLAGGIVLTNAEKLPMVVQRTLSFLPIRVSPAAQMSADASLKWRLDMWKVVLPQVPNHLLLGKGYGVDPSALYFSGDMGTHSEYDWAITAGDYHNGPLSLVMPFGLWGVLAFGWFCYASLQYLYRCHKQGAAELQTINTFLLVCFASRLIFFVFFFGGFWSDFSMFTGLIGLSISLNGLELVRKPVAQKVDLEAEFLERAYRDDYA